MTKLLINLFIKNKDDIQDATVRKNYGTLASVVGIVVNIILSVIKIIAGAMADGIIEMREGANSATAEEAEKVEETELEYVLDGEEYVLKDKAWEEKQAQAEKERIAKLSLTKREVFLGLYQAKGVTPEMIKAQITDPAALIEFEYANDYYRGNPLIDIVGATLGITPEQLDKFFETNDYTELISVPVVEVE